MGLSPRPASLALAGLIAAGFLIRSPQKAQRRDLTELGSRLRRQRLGIAGYGSVRP